MEESKEDSLCMTGALGVYGIGIEEKQSLR